LGLVLAFHISFALSARKTAQVLRQAGNASGTGSSYITLRYNVKTFVHFYDFFRSLLANS
jgi:hypothetical protein